MVRLLESVCSDPLIFLHEPLIRLIGKLSALARALSCGTPLTQDALRTISRARQFDCLSQSTLTIALSHHGTKRIYCCVYGSFNAVVHHGTQGTPRVDRPHGDAFDVIQACRRLAALKVSPYDGRNVTRCKKTGCPNIHFRAQRGRRTPFQPF